MPIYSPEPHKSCVVGQKNSRGTGQNTVAPVQGENTVAPVQGEKHSSPGTGGKEASTSSAAPTATRRSLGLFNSQ